ncbi:protein artemis-like isoform X1 [Chenopodium quinoa]|uniref:DNA repair metallo-beta-lactamase domain-containing protein n=1 Tax=Chenopodium quinoa TaxID=63459 RepID=A0A803KX02_CHEQI|nr:protein artemis-like isoform X1 [Chenopodium quinoa]
MPIEMPRGLPFSVDTWTPSSKFKRHHFLTHAHKDHCSGITSHSSSPIYSTRLTKSLILCYYPQVDESLFVKIEVGQSLIVDDIDGSFTVTAFDANHCPGAVMFLFEGNFGNILHTGDCRLTPDCLQNLPEKYIAGKGKKHSCQLDFVFLDCTFGKSLMYIPSRQSALQQVINCIWKHPDAPTVYLTCNVLGQEEVLDQVVQTFGSKIYVNKAKHPDFYQALELIAPQILSVDPTSRFLLFEGFPKLYEKAKKKILEARENMQPEPLIIRPSAQWYAMEETELTVTERKIVERSNLPVKDQFGVWHICYSMHSSRQELEWALELLSPKNVVSTTPECRALELDYVKKHCFSSRASDDRFWKVLGMNMEASLKVSDVLVESSGSASAVVKTYAASEELELQLPKALNNQDSLLNLPPLNKKPPITLFGRARLGYHSCILAEEMKTTSVEERKQTPLSDSECEGSLSSPLLAKNIPDCPLFDYEKLPSDACSITSVVHVSKHEQVEHNLLYSDDKENIVEKPNENTVEVVDAACVENSKYEEVEHNLLYTDDKENTVEKPNENREVIDPDTKSDMNRRDAKLCKSASYSYVRSSTGFSDNFRKLYRSMNVPVPQPLPSLVELMNSCKRPKRQVEIS